MENMELKICQSCGMPMQEEQYGTNQDGSKNDMYCCYCYKDGAFEQDCTMEQMADFCAPFEVEGGRSKTIEEAKTALMAYFPTLQRWKAYGTEKKNFTQILVIGIIKLSYQQ